MTKNTVDDINGYTHQEVKKNLANLIKSQKVLQTHYAPETFKMCSQGLTLLKFGHFTATPILCKIKFLRIQTVQKCH